MGRGKKLPKLLQDACTAGFKAGYKNGYDDSALTVARLFTMAFCVAMNKKLNIGADRFDKVRQEAMGYMHNNLLEDAETTFIQLEKEYRRLTGESIEDVVHP